MAWVGGLIGWLVIKQDDEAKARGLLILGIVMTFVWVAAGIVASLFGTLTVY
jgi:3-oxoacyl-(acyl-carrier-protein) synthase